MQSCTRRLWLLSCCKLFRSRSLTFGVVLLAATALNAKAQSTFTVTTLDDPAVGVPSNCSNQTSSASPDPSCSLRDALAAAAVVNGNSGTTAVTVNFKPSLAAIGNPATITLGAKALALPAYTTVQGLTGGSGYTLINLITIQGSDHAAFTADLSVSHAALNNLTITKSAPGLSSAGDVTVSQCTFAQNASLSGGAISSSGKLNVKDSTFTENSASSYGAAIYSTGSGTTAQVPSTQNLTVSGSTFQGNMSSLDGGAIYIGLLSVGSVDSSTFTGNTAARAGAAIYVNNGSGLSRVTNSILNGDIGDSECSGVGCSSTAKAFVISGSVPSGATDRGTIVMTVELSSGQVYKVNGDYGEFSTGASIASSFGGHLYTVAYPALQGQGLGSTLELAPQTGSITSVVFDNPSAYFTITPVPNSVLAGTGNIVGVSTASANLSKLANHGGPTQSVLPLPGSAALCAITPTSSSGTDQRGLPRATTFGTNRCQDSGAVQTNYSLSFAQQPSATTIDKVLSPPPSVQLQESGQDMAQAKALITVKDASNSLGGTTSTSTLSTGIAAFSNLTIAHIQTGDTLTASLAVGANQVSVTSNPFDVSFSVTASLTGNAVFPATVINGTSSQTFTFTNTSGSTVSITQLLIAGSPDFSQTNTCGLTLAPKTSCTVSITFSPVTAGVRSGMLTLVSNATGYSSSVALTGTGVPAPGFTIGDNTTGGPNTTLTLAAGATGTGTLKLSSMNGFAGSITLACAAQGSAPTGTNCTVSSPVTLLAAGTTTATFTITTTSRTQSAGLGGLPRHGRAAYFALLALLSMILLRVRPVRGLEGAGRLLSLLLLALSLGTAGCSGSSSSDPSTPLNQNGTAAGTYSYAITAVGNGVSARQTISLTVQ